MMRYVSFPWMMFTVVGLLSFTAYAAVREPEGRGRAGQDPVAAATEKLAADLEARERSILRREKTLKEREEELSAIEARLAQRSSELEALRGAIDSLREQVDEQHAQKVASLVKTVGAMKPAQAAGMMQQLDRPLALEVMRTMSSNKAAKLLGALPPQFAAEIAEGIAGPGGTVGVKEPLVPPAAQPAPAAQPSPAAQPAAGEPEAGAPAAHEPNGGA